MAARPAGVTQKAEIGRSGRPADYPGRMPPLRLAAIGLLLVLIDIRLGSFSLGLDLIGWGLVAAGMFQLIDLGTWFRWTRNLAVTALVLELVLIISPVAVVSVLAATLSRLTALALVFCLCSALLSRLGKRDRGYTIAFQVLRVLVPVIALASAVLAVTGAPAAVPVEWLYPIQLAGTVVLAVLMWPLGSRYSYSR